MTCLKWMERTVKLARNYNSKVRSVGETERKKKTKNKQTE